MISELWWTVWHWISMTSDSITVQRKSKILFWIPRSQKSCVGCQNTVSNIFQPISIFTSVLLPTTSHKVYTLRLIEWVRFECQCFDCKFFRIWEVWVMLEKGCKYWLEFSQRCLIFFWSHRKLSCTACNPQYLCFFCLNLILRI